MWKKWPVRCYEVGELSSNQLMLEVVSLLAGRRDGESMVA